MIALIAANQYSRIGDYQGTELPTIKATLIVVPLSHLGNAAFYVSQKPSDVSLFFLLTLIGIYIQTLYHGADSMVPVNQL
ncbi:hypothetical protein CJF32_00003612 [Rutstroemia sp. NJR-2017a WRK4]|nr:hypothetical protein CJF32_00003612 [Rutstroemia sp. NJR-2017a WRK4]